MNNLIAMEKEKIYSASLGLGKDAVLFGKWAKKGGSFIELKKDSWHEDTQYWIPDNIHDNGNLQRRLIDELVRSNSYKRFELIDLKTILLPVAEVDNLIIPLSKKYANDDDIVKLLKSSDIKDYDIWGNFEWQSADEQKLQQYSSVIELLDQPFMELQEEVHYRGGDSLKLVDHKVNVFFLPVTFFKFKIDWQIYNWIYIADGKTRLAIDSSTDDFGTHHWIYMANYSWTSTHFQIDIDNIFTVDKKSAPALVGCLSPLCLFAIGVWLVILLWYKLNGWMLFGCIIGIVLLLKYVNSLIIDAATRSAYRNRERKKQRIIEKRKDYLSKKGLSA